MFHIRSGCPRERKHSPVPVQQHPRGVSPIKPSCTLHPAPYTLQPTPDTVHRTPYTSHPTPYNLHPTPCILHQKPYSLHPLHYTLHLTPYTLHPTPSTLHSTYSGVAIVEGDGPFAVEHAHQNRLRYLLRKVNVRPPGKGSSNSHGARPVY